MNPDTPQTPQEQLEARLTVLLLGELTPHEAASLHEAIQNDAHLGELYARLKETIALVRETAVSPAGQTAAQPAPLKLSEDRRQKLLAQFKTVEPREFVEARGNQKFNFSPLLAAAAALALMVGLAGLLLPSLSKAKMKSVAVSVRSNLKQVEMAKEMWASDNAKAAGTAVTLDDLKPYLGDSRLRSLAGETYVPGRVGDPATAEVDAAHAKKAFGVMPTARPPGRMQEERVRLSASGQIAFVDKSAFENTLAGTIRESKAEDLSQKLAVKVPQESSSPKRAEIFLPPSNELADAARGSGDRFSFGLSTDSTDQNKLAYAWKSQNLFSTNVVDFSNGVQSDNTWSFDNLGTVQTPSLVSSDVAGNSNFHFFRDLNGNTNVIGDPQFVGLLDQPETKQAGSNQFVARYALTGDIKPGLDVLNKEVAPPPAVTPPVESPAVTLGANGTPVASGGFGGGRGGRRAPVAAPSTPSQQEPAGVVQESAGIVQLSGGTPPISPARAYGYNPNAINLSVDSIDNHEAAKETSHGAANVGKSGELALNRRRAGEEEGKTPTLGEMSTLGLTFAASEAAKPAQNTPLQTRQYTVSQNQLTGAFGGARGGGSGGAGGRVGENFGPAAQPPTSVAVDRDTKSVVVNTDDKTLAEQLQNVQGIPISSNAKTDNGIVLPQMAMSDERKKTSSEGFFGNSNLGWQSETVAKTPPQQESEKVVGGSTMTLARNIAASTAAPEKPKEALKEERSAEVTANDGQLTRQLKDADSPLPHAAVPPPVPQPEVQSRDNAFSTFSLNVSDVSFKLAAASLEKGVMPEPATIRSEEFINAFDYRDAEPPPGARIGFAWERSQYPFAHNHDLLRFSVKTAAAGREPGRPLNIVLLLDNSGSMERADRVQIIHEALRVLASQLQPQDTLSVVTFARTARLWVDGVPGSQAGDVAEKVGGLTPQGGTNLEEAMRLAYATALRHYLANGINRVVLLTDGAANLGNVNPEALKQKVEANRKQGIALDCFGIGWEGYNDDLLEELSRNGDGRYGFLNTPEEAASGFAGQLAGALHVAAGDVKVQVEFNPKRVTAYRQLGYAKHQLTKQQFRDNTVDAAEIGAAESGNALYVIQVNPQGDGPLATVRVRYKIPNTTDYREQAWPVPYTGTCASLDKASPAMRLSATASAFSEWLASSPYAAEVTPDQLLGYMGGVPEVYGADARPKKLEWMVRQAKSIAGK